MNKFAELDAVLKQNSGYIKAAEVHKLGISRTYFARYVREKSLERVAHGLYMAQNAWDDEMYVIQSRYPAAIFSHETALYLNDLAEREPLQYTVTVRSGSNTSNLTALGVKAYKIKPGLYELGITTRESPAGHSLKAYNEERTICDLLRSRRNIELDVILSAIKWYVRRKEKNISLLMRYAEKLSVSRIILPYLQVLL